MKRLSLILILIFLSTQIVSGAETELYSVINNPVLDPDYRWPMNDTVFTMTIDMEIVNPNIDPVDINFPDTCGFKPRVEAQFWVRMPVDFEGYFGGVCGDAITTLSYPQGYTNETKELSLIFHDLKITELLEGNYTIYLDHPDISMSYNTTMIVDFNETTIIQPQPQFVFNTVLLPVDTAALIVGLSAVYVLRKFNK